MKNEDILRTNTLFLALTRPPMVMGVALEAFSINIILAMLAFIVSNNLLYGLIWLPLHGVCVVVTRVDSQCFKVLLGRSRLGRTGNAAIWGGTSYEPY
jgi:type IV secretion system protein VirB3